MLKIAEYNTITGEKIDLKELEKYGFIFMDYDDLWYSYYYNPEENIKINYSDRELDFYLCDMTESSINILYDLIKDGLVEKVKNENRRSNKFME